MEPLCEFCGVVRAVVYCRSDSARLCLNCDFCVHSANSLSSRHERSLICDKCNSQPATVRCIEDKISLCQGCNWNGNGCSGPGHHRQRLTFYSGCPSLSELSRIWSSVLDNNNNNNNFSKLSINENSIDSTTSSDQPSINTEGGGMVANRLNELASCVKFESWITNPPVNVVPLIPPMPMPMPINNIVTVDEDSSGLPKLHGITTTQTLNAKDLDHQEEDAGGVDVDVDDDDDDDDDYNGVDLDDVALMFDENNNTTTTGYHVQDMLGGININSQEVNSRYCKEDLFMDNKNLSFTESNSLIDTNNNNALEASSCGQQDCLGFQSTRICSPVNLMQNLTGSPNSLLMNPACNRNIGFGFPPGQVHPSMSLSLSNITGESSATDYQDCGLSPVFLSGESPWESNLEPTHPHSRDKAKMRYHEKKKTRMFGKQIRYASRKARADTRKRVKGRFVKAGEAYDYDPLN